MADLQSNQMYTAEDVQRYLDGSMTAREMHELERAALHDPFLADAIDGYRDADPKQTRQHLNDIAAAIQGRQQDTPVVAIQPRRIRWYSAAAVVLLIAGAGTITWKLMQPGTVQPEVQSITLDNRLQQNDTLKQEIRIDTGLLVAEHKAPVQDHTAVQQKPASGGTALKGDRNRETLSNLIRTDDRNSTTAADDTLPVNQQAEPSTDLASASTSVPGRENAPAMLYEKSVIQPYARNYTIRGRILDNQQIPVPNAIVDAGNKQSVVSDINGNFVLVSPDSVVLAEVSSLGFTDIEKQLSGNVFNQVILTPSQETLSEVVISSYSKNKAKQSNDATTGAYPAGGWTSFQEYVYKKLNRAYDSLNNAITAPGNVELEFEIRDDGTPMDFKVLKSLNPVADTAAMDIVKEGPRWISDKKRRQKGKVTIRF